MILVLIFLCIIIILFLFFLVLLLSSIKLEIKDFELSNITEITTKDYMIKMSINLFGKIKIFTPQGVLVKKWQWVNRCKTVRLYAVSRYERAFSRKRRSKAAGGCFSVKKNGAKRTLLRCGDPWGNRTPVIAVKGRCLNRLTNGP